MACSQSGSARTAIREAEIWNSTVAQTSAVITSTGNAANYSAEQQLKYVSSLEKLVAIDDDIINQGANILRTFTQISNAETFEAGTLAALNMSAALKKDLNSSATMVGKALNAPLQGITALQRAGVQFTDSQKSQIRALVESGRVMEAQKVILAELEVQFGGAAEANADASEKARLGGERLAQTFGQVLLPAVELAATGLDVVSRAFDAIGPSGARAVVGVGASSRSLRASWPATGEPPERSIRSASA